MCEDLCFVKMVGKCNQVVWCENIDVGVSLGCFWVVGGWIDQVFVYGVGGNCCW